MVIEKLGEERVESETKPESKVINADRDEYVHFVISGNVVLVGGKARLSQPTLVSLSSRDIAVILQNELSSGQHHLPKSCLR